MHLMLSLSTDPWICHISSRVQVWIDSPPPPPQRHACLHLERRPPPGPGTGRCTHGLSLQQRPDHWPPEALGSGGETQSPKPRAAPLCCAPLGCGSTWWCFEGEEEAPDQTGRTLNGMGR